MVSFVLVFLCFYGFIVLFSVTMSNEQQVDGLVSNRHQPIMVEQVLLGLDVKPGGVYADVTLGYGGHTEAILEASSPDGRVIACDQDPSAIEWSKQRLARFGSRVTLIKARFSDLRQSLNEAGAKYVDGILADIGVSSPQLDESERGFSFRQDAPLDMRMDPSQGETAFEFLERVSERELADVLFQYGEERKSFKIAQAIKMRLHEGRLQTTVDLKNAVHSVIRGYHKIDQATRTFQAIRIAVNQELEELNHLLNGAKGCLNEGGRLGIITFHSLEDRKVKWAFRANEGWAPLYKKPVMASDEEQKVNPRSRSAKWRVGIRTNEMEVQR